MLVELAVENLGVMAHLRLVLEAGMTVVTGETGAGKTLIVEAIDLLAGGRADASVVREGASEAVIEGRFVAGDDELVIRRIVPAQGRSRAYVDGSMATAKTLAGLVASQVELYAQHAQHSLMTVAGQRRALDRFAGIDLGELTSTRAVRKDLEAQLRSLGGDAASREREIDLLRFQVAELDEAGPVDPEEDDRLANEQAALADVEADRERATGALSALTEDSGALDAIGIAVGRLSGSTTFGAEHQRLSGLAAELDDAAGELRRRAETLCEDPERLAELTRRRQLLATLRRRHGDGTLGGVITEHRRLAERLTELENAEARCAEIGDQLVDATAAVDAAAAEVGRARRRAAPELARRVQAELRDLAMPGAIFDVHVSDIDPGDDVEMLFTANPGTTPNPLARVASGGELARAMLALRLVSASEQDCVIFDEVDAGIGGTAASAVGSALARLGASRQVLVVTHLAQVAAAADHHIGVDKVVADGQTITSGRVLTGDARVVELSRMLSGQPSSDSARAHARELLAGAGRAGGDV